MLHSATVVTQHPTLWARFGRQYEVLLALGRRARRALVRRWRLSLAGIALALTLGLAAPTLNAAPNTVITVDGTTCVFADAIKAANTNAAVNGCTAGSSGLDTLDITPVRRNGRAALGVAADSIRVLPITIRCASCACSSPRLTT